MHSPVSHELQEELNTLQMDLFIKGTPVLVVFEGNSGRVVSRVINEVARVMEPRGVNCTSIYDFSDPMEVFSKLLGATPGQGEITLMDRSWYSLQINGYQGDGQRLKEAAETVKGFEEYLLDNGTFIVKIDLSMCNEAIDKHLEDFRSYTALNSTYLSTGCIDRVKFDAVFDDLASMSRNPRAPWDVVDVKDLEKTVNNVVKVMNCRFRECLSSDHWRKQGKHRLSGKYPNPRKTENSCELVSGYSEKLERLSNELEQLQILLAITGRSLVVGFEGWDAAGKGGAIKHLCHALNPRGYAIARVKAPTSEEKAHTHLWRFARSLPAGGHISIFDRTWYGRMLVEPIEGFCSEDDYDRSADEINAFEKFLYDSNAIVLKFWLDIDKETQLQRFNDRMDDPLKQWKLTDE
ncbi:MAG: hypothetical protein MJZ68_09410, partial [archaeon]|nr:hypothetical protein [archaeon]